MIRYILIFQLILCQYSNGWTQFFDDFSDSDLNSNPVWEGNQDHFVVNEGQMLQLNAPMAGTSILYTQINLPDSIQWDFEISMDFSPSSNNRLRIYLVIDQLDIEVASGYFLEIGENGANDAINFFYLNDGTPELLASGEMSAVAQEPVFARVSIRKFPEEEWVVSTAYQENVPLSEELVFNHDLYNFTGNQFFLLECHYTASRTDRFFFDNIGIRNYEPDMEGPILLGAELLDPRTLEVQANEKLDAQSALSEENYTLEGFSGSISSIELINGDTGIRLVLNDVLESGKYYDLKVNGLLDVNGNRGESNSYIIFVIEDPLPGDIVINEILFNPETGGSDFVEILNVSEKFISLDHIELANLDKQEVKSISADYTMLPGTYLCLTEDVAYVQNRYDTPDTANIVASDLPSFNNDSGNVAIISSETSSIIDSFNYSESLHYPELDDINGVSLERISPFDTKWFSASSSVGYGTPGYQNSVFLNPSFSESAVLSFKNKTFSPNQDGVDDQLVIKYKFPENGYQVDINVYDQYGRHVRNLLNNELLAATGFLLWNGINDDGELSGIGIYFVVLEAFNVQGDVISVKKPVILADYLK
ncbi:T9SS type B sorting domain-containing protein [Portibacter marinus]|uniref:T9SS type B sorting domain-containing protein n=1 Tax=Portibacter marinus TaxID=2898660 RepID=UPI001F25A8D9|nr:gliding motility-associated C-terminal domain-containing protein [Portibacter marinus]